ncbi:TRAP transporter large permease subunit [Elioraea sp.]|uniref:TRAP transporter large permease n=1 Tax=Elioraea sp. TaxID=2185103 RepID=UPI0025BF40E6|nr:TRAP transporter large permease subunit [Elioraea sp.]
MPPIELVTLLIIGGILVTLLIGVPLAFSSGAIAVALTLWIFGPDALMLLSSRTYSFLDSYVLVSVPLFVLMASILERSGLARDLYTAFSVWAGRLRGGIAAMTTMVGVVLAATVGVIGGEIVVLGLVALPQLLRLGYQRRLAIGTVCSAGSLGTMIPPSIILVFYGLTANVPIGDLFLATLVPGLLLASLYIGYILTRCALDPTLGPLPPPEILDMPMREKIALLRGVALPLFVAFTVLGSIYLGIASVTESAGMGVAGTLIACLIRGELRLSLLREAVLQTMSTCGVVLWLVLGTNALIGVYNLVGGIAYATALFRSIPLPPLGIVLVMVGVWILLGMFLDWIGIMLLTMPIFVPTITALGFDPLWFGILFNIAMQIAYLTPPFAPAAFYLKGVAPPDMSLEEIFGAMWPFVGLQVVGLALVIAFPQLALWLPKGL